MITVCLGVNKCAHHLLATFLGTIILCLHSYYYLFSEELCLVLSGKQRDLKKKKVLRTKVTIHNIVLESRKIHVRAKGVSSTLGPLPASCQAKRKWAPNTMTNSKCRPHWPSRENILMVQVLPSLSPPH